MLSHVQRMSCEADLGAVDFLKKRPASTVQISHRPEFEEGKEEEEEREEEDKITFLHV